MKTQATVMTYAEMEAAFDREWVLVGDPDLTPMLQIIRGVVLAHDQDRIAVYEALWQLQAQGRAPSDIAVHFIGERPNDVEFLL